MALIHKISLLLDENKFGLQYIRQLLSYYQNRIQQISLLSKNVINARLYFHNVLSQLGVQMNHVLIASLKKENYRMMCQFDYLLNSSIISYT